MEEMPIYYRLGRNGTTELLDGRYDSAEAAQAALDALEDKDSYHVAECRDSAPGV